LIEQIAHREKSGDGEALLGSRPIAEGRASTLFKLSNGFPVLVIALSAFQSHD